MSRLFLLARLKPCSECTWAFRAGKSLGITKDDSRRQLTTSGDILRSSTSLLRRGSSLMQTMMPFYGLLGCCAPSARALSLAIAPTLLFSPAAAQARFAGLAVCHDNRDIFLVGLDNTFGGYYYAGFLLACLEPFSERTRTFRAGKRRRPPLLENQNRLRLRRLRLEISGLFPPNYCFCAIGLRPRKTSGYTDAEGREEVGVARLTPTVLRTAILCRTGSSPDTETLQVGLRRSMPQWFLGI